MSDKPISPLRQRMIDDMTARRFSEKVQKAYVRHVRTFTAFLGRSPDTATSEDHRRFQLHMAQQQISPGSINAAIAALRFFFNVTLERPDLVSSDDHQTDRFTLPRQRREYLRPYRQLVQDAGDWSDYIGKADTTILDHNLAIVQVTAHRRIRRLVEWLIWQSVPDPRREGTSRADHAKNTALDAPEVDTGGIEHSRSCLGDRIERALTVLWCAGNDTENVSRRGLTVEAFPQILEQPRVLDSDDGLAGEVFD